YLLERIVEEPSQRSIKSIRQSNDKDTNLSCQDFKFSTTNNIKTVTFTALK
ncbi:hypothetical protein S83_053818, partial [Arachis hypogaea]